MSAIPDKLWYTKTHEWARVEPNGDVTVGITDHAQSELKDVVFVELPQSGRTLKAAEASAVVESVKAAFDIYAPVSGQVIRVNAALEKSPQLINHEPYGQGWFFVLKPADTRELETLLSPGDYAKLLTSAPVH